MHTAGYHAARRSPPPSQVPTSHEKHVINTPSGRQMPATAMSPGNRGWMSFDESPVHAIQQGTQAQPKPTYGPVSTIKTEGPWATFSENQSGPEINTASPSQSHMHQTPRTAVVQPVQKDILNSHQNVPQVPTLIQQSAIPQYIAQNTASPLSQPNTPIQSSVYSLPNQVHQQPIGAIPPQTIPTHPVYTPTKPQSQNVQLATAEVVQQTPGSRGQRVPSSDDSINEGNASSNPWQMTHEQRQYYIKQFTEIQPDTSGKIDGQTARNFFTKSRLPIVELSHIWELSDIDQDGHLNLDEFCAAFHLVVARKNGYDIPISLPQSLIPTLIDIGDGPNKHNIDKSGVGLHLNQKHKEKTDEITATHSSNSMQSSPEKQIESKTTKPHLVDSTSKNTIKNDKWETFSDMTSSSTTLANFEQHPVENENLPHPLATRVTPSRHEAHSAKLSGNFAPKSTDDGDSTPPQPSRVPAPHRSLTNPYGSLNNETSEPDTSYTKGKRSTERRRSSSSSTSVDIAVTPQVSVSVDPIETAKLCNSDNDPDQIDSPYSNDISSNRPIFTNHRKPRRRSVSLDSSSSIASDHSSATDNSAQISVKPNHRLSDQEHSDWSSRPLRPRSGSDSSDSPSLQNLSLQHPALSAPTPPPRPNQSKSNSLDKQQSLSGPDIISNSSSAPTPPPRPNATNQISGGNIPQETFADFSQFKRLSEEMVDQSNKVENESESTETQQELAKTESERPVPAPRHARDKNTAESSESEIKDDESSTSEKLSASKKAPTKPPRMRMMSADSGLTGRHADLHTSTLEEHKPAPIKQEIGRKKSELQQAIRSMKLKNNELTRLNAELQQQLKDVMQSRIAVEMSIHQLRPFSQ